MKIVVNLPDNIVDAYLKHVNEVYGTKFKLKTLKPKQHKAVEKVFAEAMKDEFEMRTDDLDAFEAEQMFIDALDIDTESGDRDE